MRRTHLSLVFVGLAIVMNLARPGRAVAANVFTDEPLMAGAPIKAVAITELRSIINILRSDVGLSGVVFTDPDLRGMIVKAQHVLELRSALEDAAIAAGLRVPVYTDATLNVQQTVIKAAHIMELRAAVLSVAD